MEFNLITGLCFWQDLEKLLDVFNITLARQQAQMEVKVLKKEDHSELIPECISFIKLNFSYSSPGDQVRTESGVKKGSRGAEAGRRRRIL